MRNGGMAVGAFLGPTCFDPASLPGQDERNVSVSGQAGNALGEGRDQGAVAGQARTGWIPRVSPSWTLYAPGLIGTTE